MGHVKASLLEVEGHEESGESLTPRGKIVTGRVIVRYRQMRNTVPTPTSSAD